MTQRTQQSVAALVFGIAVATAFAIVVPGLLAAPSVATAEELPPIPTAPALAEASDGDSEAVDMTHWQETAQPKSPYKPGKVKKKK